jgi:hypothetical protein
LGQRSRSSSPAGPTPGADYAAWLTTVPDEQREAVAEIVEKHVVSDYKSFGQLAQKVMAEVLRGRITPEVAKEARAWAELLFTSLATEASAHGNPAMAIRDSATAIVAAIQMSQTLEPSYSTRVRDVITIEDKRRSNE